MDCRLAQHVVCINLPWSPLPSWPSHMVLFFHSRSLSSVYKIMLTFCICSVIFINWIYRFKVSSCSSVCWTLACSLYLSVLNLFLAFPFLHNHKCFPLQELALVVCHFPMDVCWLELSTSILLHYSLHQSWPCHCLCHPYYHCLCVSLSFSVFQVS